MSELRHLLAVLCVLAYTDREMVLHASHVILQVLKTLQIKFDIHRAVHHDIFL
jgi:hypothetical protein